MGIFNSFVKSANEGETKIYKKAVFLSDLMVFSIQLTLIFIGLVKDRVKWTNEGKVLNCY